MSRYGGYPDHDKTRPIISYDVGRGTRTYVTRIETHVQEVRRPTIGTGFKYANSSLKGDPSKESRPREVDEFITQILDEVNGPPNWSRHGDPMKVEPKRDYGLDYKYGGSPMKSKEVPRDYGDPYRQRGGSFGQPLHRDYSVPRDDYRAPDNQTRKEYSVPNNQWNDSHVKSQTLRDHEVPKNGWDRSSRVVHDPNPHHQYPIKPEALEDYEVLKDRGDSSHMKSQTPRDQRVDRPSIPVYDDHSPNNQSIRSSEMPKGYGVPNNRWGNPPTKPQSPKGYVVPNNQSDRSSSPIYDYPLSSGNPGGLSDSRWDNPSMKPQSPKSYGVPDTQRDHRSSIPIYDHPPANRNTNGVPNSRFGNPRVKPQSPKGYEVPNNNWDRSSSPIHDHLPQNGSTSGVTNSRLGNPHLNPQSHKDYGVPNKHNQWDSSTSPVHDQVPNKHNQWDRSTSPVHDQSYTPPNGNISSVPNNRWGYSPVKPLSPKDYGVLDNKLERSSSPIYNHPPPNENIRVPNNQWGNPLEKPQSPKGYGIPNNQMGNPSSPIYDHPPPNENTSRVPTSRWGNPPIQPQSPKRYGIPNNQMGGSLSPIYDHPLSDANIGHHEQPPVTCKDGVCTFNDKPNATRGTYDEPKGNHKPVGYPSDPYTHYGSGNLVKPKGYQTTTPLSKVTNNIGEAMEQLQVSARGPTPTAGKSSAPATVTGPRPRFSVPGPGGPKWESVAGPLDIDSREAAERYGGHSLPSGPYTGKEDQKKTITSKEAREKYNGSLVPN